MGKSAPELQEKLIISLHLEEDGIFYVPYELNMVEKELTLPQLESCYGWRSCQANNHEMNIQLFPDQGQKQLQTL